jgi:hypothetical protein
MWKRDREQRKKIKNLRKKKFRRREVKTKIGGPAGRKKTKK